MTVLGRTKAAVSRRQSRDRIAGTYRPDMARQVIEELKAAGRIPK